MRTLLQEHRASGKNYPLIGGHRGCRNDVIENTINAMEKGLTNGADYLEIDVQLTRDGIPVVFHDVNLAERTPLTGYIHNFTFKELADAFYIETLAEVMAWGHERNAYFAIELKSFTCELQKYNFALLDPLYNTIAKAGMLANVYAFGLDYSVLTELKKKHSDLETGLICPIVPVDPSALMKAMSAMVYLTYVTNLTPKIIAELQANGYYVSGAILRDDSSVKRAVDYRVDMFEYDYPEKLVGKR